MIVEFKEPYLPWDSSKLEIIKEAEAQTGKMLRFISAINNGTKITGCYVEEKHRAAFLPKQQETGLP